MITLQSMLTNAQRQMLAQCQDESEMQDCFTEGWTLCTNCWALYNEDE